MQFKTHALMEGHVFHITEADLAAEVYGLCKSMGWEPHLEIKVPSTAHKSGFMRVDVLCVLNGSVDFLIELKRPGKKVRDKGKTRQSVAYGGVRSLGIDVLWANSLEDVRKFLVKRKSSS